MRIRTEALSTGKSLLNRVTLGLAAVLSVAIMSVGSSASAQSMIDPGNGSSQNGYGGSVCTGDDSCQINIDIDVIIVGNGNAVIINVPSY